MIEIYGIANCDTVKKARRWLNERDVEYQFHDFKKQAPTEAMLQAWCQQSSIDALLNKRGTTWRKLSEQAQQMALANQDGGISALCAQPSMIKRPVLVTAGKLRLIGFDPVQYEKLLLGPGPKS